MHNDLWLNILALNVKTFGCAKMSVNGSSMLPVIKPCDTITVEKSKEYSIGDIIVFLYSNNLITVHRLLKIENDIYFCKGDNSFRLEDIKLNRIIGKVVAVNDKKIINWPQWKSNLSYKVNRVFRIQGYDVLKTKDTNLYKAYCDIIGIGEKEMKYQKNTSMEYINADETALAIFNPSTGNVYFANETGSQILKVLECSRTVKEIVDILSVSFSTTADVIRNDVEMHLTELVEKNIVIVID